MRHRAIAVLLICAAILGGCTEGVLDPVGPIAAAEKQILINSTAHHAGDRHSDDHCDGRRSPGGSGAATARRPTVPTGNIPARIEMVVWSIPALTIMLLGGITWIGSHDLEPSKPLVSTGQAGQGRGRLARLEMAVHLPRPGHRDRQPTGRPGRHAGQLPS